MASTISGGVPINVPAFPGGYVDYIGTIGYDPFSGFYTLPYIQTFGYDPRTGYPTLSYQQLAANYALEQQQLELQRQLGMAGLDLQRQQLALQQQRAALDAAIAQAQLQAQMLDTQARVEIARGNLQLGYAQLNESARQFALAHQLNQQRLALDTAMQVAEIAANPRNWIQMAYLARGLEPPPGTEQFIVNPLDIVKQMGTLPPPSVPTYTSPNIPMPSMGPSMPQINVPISAPASSPPPALPPAPPAPPAWSAPPPAPTQPSTKRMVTHDPLVAKLYPNSYVYDLSRLPGSYV